MNLLTHFQAQFIIPVIRETTAQALESICLALADGGLKILEITLMSETAFTIIKKLSQQNDLIVGAGTVLTAEQARKALDAGAKFLVSPNLNTEAIQVAQQSNIAFFPGVLTPTEITQAKAQGCELVKVFPISALGGPAYLKSLREPFPQLKWMATGGVTLTALKDYMQAGATCVGLGKNLILTEKVKTKDWQALRSLAAYYVNIVRTERV